jgi:hypothetical protein
MKKDEIEVGQAYTAKVSGNLTTVVIEVVSPHGGWDAINTRTGKQVRIKSAQRLRRKTTQPRFLGPKKPNPRYKAPAKTGEELKAIHKADQENARLADERAASGDGMAASERAMAESAPSAKKARKAAGKAKAAKKPNTGERGASSGQPKRLSALNAAVKVLEERDPADGPLSCAQMIERMAAKGYWTPVRGGLTPANTLYSAVLREINAKGENSRFEKVDRGRFTLTARQ